MSYVKVKEEEPTLGDELTEVENTAVVCDGCGETFEDDYGPSFVDEVEADDAIAEDKGWVKVTEDNSETHHYCEKCRIDNKNPSDVIEILYKKIKKISSLVLQKQFAYSDKKYNFTMGTGGTISLLVFSKNYDLEESHSVNSKKLFMNWKELSDEEFNKEVERVYYILCKIENILTK